MWIECCKNLGTKFIRVGGTIQCHGCRTEDSHNWYFRVSARVRSR